MTLVTAQTLHGKNDTRFDDMLAQVRELGIKAGRGKDTLVQFGLLVMDAAYNGVLDLTKDKHGDGADDAVKAYAEYSRAMAATTIFDHKTPSGKVQAAKLRSLVKCGGWTRGGPGEPISTVNKLMAMREKMRRNPVECRTLDDAYSTLLRFARFQVKQTSVADDAMLRAFCTKGVSKTKTVEELIQGVVKNLQDLSAGRAQSNTLQHNSPLITDAIMSLKGELTTLRSKPETE